MSVTYAGYRVVNSITSEVSALIVPRWDGSYTSLSPGTYPVPDYLVRWPDCPYEATWFCAGSTTYNFMTAGGFQNVIDVDTMVTSGASLYFESQPEAEIRFEKGKGTDANRYRIKLYRNGIDTEAWLTIYSSGPTQNYRAISFFSDIFYDATGAYWAIHNFTLTEQVNILVYSNQPVPIYAGMNREQFDLFWTGVEPIIEPTDPYEPGGESAPGGGDGTFDFSSTPIDYQAAPIIGAYATGMVDLYVPSVTDLQALSAYLWAGAFDINNFRKIVADPMDTIIGLSILPVTDTEIGVTSSTLAVGNISTGISMPRANRQYVVIDCGSVNILPKWGAYLDFAPYTKLQLFLPYIGYVDISPDDVMNGTIGVRYTVDILSGTVLAQVKCKDHVLYELSGAASCSCPITAGQYQNIALGALRLAGAISSMATGNAGGVVGGINEAANAAIATFKPNVQRSGSMGGSSGLMGHQIPYLILTVPRMCTPGQQNVMIGYPSFITKSLGDLTGFCTVHQIHIKGIQGASEADLDEIESLLRGGVYL